MLEQATHNQGDAPCDTLPQGCQSEEQKQINALAMLAGSGDVQAFTELYVLFNGRTARIFNQLCGVDEVEDLNQEFWAKMAERKLSMYRADRRTAFTTWLGTCAHNHAFDHLRRQTNTRDLCTELEDEQWAMIPSPRINPGDEVKQYLKRLDQIRRMLDQENFTIWYAFQIEGSTYTEIASAMQMPIGTIKSRLYRSREMLRVKLSAHWQATTRKRRNNKTT